MYGMINRAVRDLVLDVADDATWQRIAARVEFRDGDFADSYLYDDQLTYDLVDAASAELGLPAEDILTAFGRHWVLYTGHQGWGPLMDMAGDDFRTFVGGLDSLHARVQAAMPESRMPSFAIAEENATSMHVEYRSERPGLAPMVVGLFEGLAERFGESWDVAHVGRLAGDDGDLFRLDAVDSAADPDTEEIGVGARTV